jgi:uncharacterized protein DUF5681
MTTGPTTLLPFSRAHKPELGIDATLRAMRPPQNRDGSGRWAKGVSGNPGGRPKGQAALSKSARKLVGEDGEALVDLWWSIANDPMRRAADRLRASELFADRGWGKAANFEPVEGDPLGLEDAKAAEEECRAKILRLAAAREQADSEGGTTQPSP